VYFCLYRKSVSHLPPKRHHNIAPDYLLLYFS